MRPHDNLWPAMTGEASHLPCVVSESARPSVNWRVGPRGCGPSLPPRAGLGMTRRPLLHASPRAGTRPCAASQASRAVSSMRALRPMCTTGRRPVHRSLAKVSELTPNHRCASSRGISWGGGGISRGRSCCRGDERGRARGRLDIGGMAGGSPLKSRVGDTGGETCPTDPNGVGRHRGDRSEKIC
jgi:hypothetical protein